MVRISPLVSRDVVEKLFLPKFCELCSESMFHIRKVCATSIGEMCRVVGPQLSEEFLLQKFFNLCEDGIWGVRKACTECFMEVSNSLSPDARRSDLAQLYVGLLCDQSRWVRMSAFQALGPFISTFANPNMTGLYFDQDGILRVQQPPPSESSSQSSSQKSVEQNVEPTSSSDETTTANEEEKKDQDSAVTDPATSAPEDTFSVAAEVGSASPQKQDEDMDLSLDSDLQADIGSEQSKEHLVSNPIISNEEVRWKQYSDDTELVYVPGEVEQSKIVDDFGSFKYWRDPVPTLDLNSILQEVTQTSTAEGAVIHHNTAVQSTEEGSNQTVPTTTTTNTTQDKSSALSDDASAPQQRTVDENLEALASSLQTGITINTSARLASSTTEPSHTDHVQSFMFGPTSTPLSAGTVLAPTYASVLSKGSLSPSMRNRHQSTGSSGGESLGSLSELMAKQQDIIPHLLLENYLSMTDPSRAQTVDTDIAQHCAYSLPAVAYTLGKDNWKCLRSLYETLVSDMQWKVRRTLAFSIHELAVILGTELTHSDLVPIFNGFIKDLDEVRIGVLTHLSDFLRLLSGDVRRTYLPKIAEFMQTDNNRVWRTRLDLAQQLVKMCDLFSSKDIIEFIVPLSLALLSDRVADVRTASLPLMSTILGLLQEPTEDQQRLMLINDLIEKLALSEKWHARQTYVQACHRVLQTDSLLLDQFSKELLPSLLTLSMDKIPNVRISVAKLLSQCLLPLEYFTSSRNPHHDELLKAESRLKSDTDRDVRYFAGLSPQTNIENHDTVDV